MKSFNPILPRTHRRCSTTHCSHAALFFPVLEWGPKKSYAIELSIQFCPQCREQLNSMADFVNQGFTSLDAELFVPPKKVKGMSLDIDMTKALITWYPLIVGADSPPEPSAHSQRLHD